MHKRLPRLMALWLAATLAAPLSSAQDTMSAEQLYQYLAPSVWLVRSLDADGLLVSTGSAVVTGVETLLTNCHVLKGAKRLVVRNDNVLHEARLRHIDVERDLCEISARNLRAPAVALGDSDQLTVGQKVYALGNPRGLELTLSDGIVSALRRDEDLRHLHFIQTTAPISPGSSGGGLFDNQGRLIGITTLQFKDGQNLNFAIPINWQRDLAARSDAGLNARQTVGASKPDAARSDTAAVDNVDAIPVSDVCKAEYRKYVVASAPKAFAITTAGKCAWQMTRTPNRPQVSVSPDPAVRAMELCVHWHKTGCFLYAVDSAVVYRR